MTSRRFLFVVLLGVFVAGALAAGRASSAPRASDPNAAPSAAAISKPSGVWFCPGLPPTLPRRSGRVSFANISDVDAEVVVTDLPDTGRASQVTIKVAAYSVVARTRDQLGAPGALTVETFGGRVLVEEGIEGAQALETTPCATQTSTHSYFAAGATPRGVQQWLVIDNPYASDAKVDVTLRTSSGVLRPDAIQGLDISRRSRVIVPIHDLAVRKARVAVEVAASLGSVVAAQTLVYTTTAGRPGVALSIGSPVAGTDWTFAGATAKPGSALVAISNVGDDDAHVDVQATAELSKQALASASITVGPDDVMWLLLGQCAPAATKTPASGTGCVSIPNGVSYSLDVRAEQGVSIVAQTLTRFEATDVVGTVTSAGGIEPTDKWAFARSRVRGERSTSLSLFNPGAAPAVVDVGLAHDGTIDRPGALQDVTVPPGRAVTLVVVGGRRPATRDAALIISASTPIFAERLITTGDEASSAVGIIVR